ncbi:hypothetical protein TREMEDRAFT_56382 [Tremella mesenterica DSM 1558]|uniref:uncharacterized protein n=1 Tax=Tremella mesenterica (strain ATCC 24925 / CBS 8224 / DSM 1558 / NBRC 9311 / NRRL Y-6157 / RJB 2259-6 / UBC 559-6) TaxID=578456 RepID=UPI0003F48E7F|nr:uncharacterized protein TREMEDRAFT_56382 [Tremella mesenterica DSM 1558]EIW71278.1 hypothetical protein TREMEDRAFT_56382 [Tremella mesenterica DSM 1558]
MNWDGPRIVMGGRVSRPSSPEGEKSMSIEVPAIILTEPPPYSSPFPSPGGKSTILLPAVILPLSSSYPCSPPSSNYVPTPLYSSNFANALIRPQGSGYAIGTALRTVLLLLVISVGAWHLYSSLCADHWEGGV